jgi:hypothetical protein
VAVLAAITALGVAACGDDDDSGSSSAATSEAAAPATSEAAPATSEAAPATSEEAPATSEEATEATEATSEATEEATRGFARRESAHFVILYQPGKDEVLVDLAAETLEAAWREIGGDLGYRPAGKVRVEILPRVADLARVSPLTEREIETSGTIALCKYNKLMLVTPRATLLGYPWLDSLAHEYTHFVVARITEDRAPVWMHEGIAKFEESRWRAVPGAGGLGPTLEHLLAMALRKGRLIGFDEMHPSLAKLPSQEAAATASSCVAVTLATSDSSSAANSSSAASRVRASSRYARISSADPPYLRMSALSLSYRSSSASRCAASTSSASM